MMIKVIKKCRNRYKKLDIKKKALVVYIALFIISVIFTFFINMGVQNCIKIKYTGYEALDNYARKVNEMVMSKIVEGDIEHNDDGKDKLKKLNKSYPDVIFMVSETEEYVDDNGEASSLVKAFYPIIIPSYLSTEMNNIYSNSAFGTFSDGTACSSWVIVLSSRKNRIEMYGRVISILAGVILYVVAIILYTTQIYRKIATIKLDVDKIGGGSRENIKDYGNDELGTIVNAVNKLKNSALESKEKEDRAINDKNNMARNLAHDIRTPLTVIAGNLELLEYMIDSGADKERMLDNIRSCQDKIQIIKNLTGNIFVQEKAVVLHMEDIMSTYMEEYYEQLYRSGFEVNVLNVNSTVEAAVNIKPNQFKRVLSNIISNIIKYASREDKVNIFVSDNTITIENLIETVIRNEYVDTKVCRESNYIGQNVCSDIMKDMGGTYTHWIKNGQYYSKIALDMR